MIEAPTKAIDEAIIRLNKKLYGRARFEVDIEYRSRIDPSSDIENAAANTQKNMRKRILYSWFFLTIQF